VYCETYCEMFQRFGMTACEGCAGRRKERRCSMLVYFIEQVWSIDQEWNQLYWLAHEISRSWWDKYAETGNRIGYPQKHMELGVDYIEF
jgi:hypothetical protein